MNINYKKHQSRENLDSSILSLGSNGGKYVLFQENQSNNYDDKI